MSTLKADTIVAADGTSPVTLTKQSAAKSFVYFDGIGTLAVHSTFNVSSVSDDGVGEYTVTITSNHSDVFYAKLGSAGRDSSADQGRWLGFYDATTGQYEVQAQYDSSTEEDAQVSGITHGDLA